MYSRQKWAEILMLVTSWADVVDQNALVSFRAKMTALLRPEEDQSILIETSARILVSTSSLLLLLLSITFFQHCEVLKPLC